MPLKLWDQHKDWEVAETIWQENAQKAAAAFPLKQLKNFPKMPGITEETASGLRWKSFKWMIKKDKNFVILKNVLKHPFKHFKNYVSSLCKKNSFIKEGDFFYYGMKSLEQFKGLLQSNNTILLLGFSYCHKPFECPSGRFTDQCIYELENRVCQQCFIGKCFHALPEKGNEMVVIPTVHYIGEKVFEVIKKHPGKQIIFLITACELTLSMFADWGNMVNIKGIGVRLEGRICNTMKAFELSEEGIKPGLTIVLDQSQDKILKLLRLRRFFSGFNT